MPLFIKQTGARPVQDGRLLTIRSSKGGALEDLPADLRVREFPEASHGL